MRGFRDLIPYEGWISVARSGSGGTHQRHAGLLTEGTRSNLIGSDSREDDASCSRKRLRLVVGGPMLVGLGLRDSVNYDAVALMEGEECRSQLAQGYWTSG